MADDNQKSAGAGVQEAGPSTGQSQPPPLSGGQTKGGWSFGRATPVHLGRPIFGQTIITNVAIEGEPVQEGANNDLKPYRRVVISGQNLKPLAGWGLRTINGAPYDLQLSALDDDHISFYPAYHKGHIAPGTIVDIVFYPKDRAAQTFELPFKFEYNPAEDKDKNKKAGGAGGKQGAAGGGGGSNTIGAMIGDTIGGTAGVFAEGIAGGAAKAAASPTATAPAAAVKKQEDEGANDGGGGEEDYVTGVESETTEQEVSSPISSAAEIGGPTIASGTTVRQAAATIGTAGTVETGQVISGGGGATTVQGQQTAQVSGTVSRAEQTEVSGTISGTQQTQVSGTTQVSGGGTTSVGGTVEASGGGQKSVGATVQTAGGGQSVQENAEIKSRQTITGHGQATENISGQMPGGESISGTAEVSGGGQTSAGGISSTVSGGQIPGGGIARTQIRAEGQLPQTSAPGGTSAQTSQAPATGTSGQPLGPAGTSSFGTTLSQAGTLGAGGTFSAGGGTGLGTMPKPAKLAPTPAPEASPPGQEALEEELKESAKTLPNEEPSPAQDQQAQAPEKEEAPKEAPDQGQLAGGGASAPQEIIPQKRLGAVDAAVKKPLVMRPLSAGGIGMANKAGDEVPAGKSNLGGRETEPRPGKKFGKGPNVGPNGLGKEVSEQESKVPGSLAGGGPGGEGALLEQTTGTEAAPTKSPEQEGLPSGPGVTPRADAPGAGDEGVSAPDEETSPGALPGGAAGKAPVPTSAAGGAIAAEIGKTASSKIWYFGFASSAATWFSGLDFMVGGLVMAAYWMFFHRKDPKLFPLKKWQKAVTYLAFILPLFYLSIGIAFIIYAGCNYPLPYNSVTGYRGSVIGAIYPSSCTAMGSATNSGIGAGNGNFNLNPTPTPPSPPATPASALQPRGTTP